MMSMATESGTERFAPGSPVAIDGERSHVRVAIQDEFGWREWSGRGCRIWCKGYGAAVDPQSMAERLTVSSSVPDPDALCDLFAGFEGHFAVVAQGPGWTMAAVDAVRSIPVAWARAADGWVIDDQAERLRGSLGLTTADIDDAATVALAMSGYTIDVATLYKGINQLGPGELVLFADSREPVRHRYYTYRPWRADKPAFEPDAARQGLADLTLSVIDGMMREIGDRVVCVPLSAGNDSRLIVSAARHLGYDNVRTFAYGRVGNHEAETSKIIAERLGYPWTFVATDRPFMRRFYDSEDYRGYLRFADTAQSVPFVQDQPQIAALKQSGYIPDDSVFVNGNSGDYISGAHLPPALQAPFSAEMDGPARLDRAVAALYDKHFALWQYLRTPQHRAAIEAQLRRSIERAGAHPLDPANDFGLYEYAEFQDRQCKFVITGQRIYEYLGHEWRLPLWSRGLLDFFETVPLEGKRRQRLYADMLRHENWGGVWHDIPVNRETIKPDWVRPIRFAAKVLHAPLGRAAWRRSERRYFRYWMEPGSHSAFRSYRDVAFDRRGARNGISWLTERYLAEKGVALDDV